MWLPIYLLWCKICAALPSAVPPRGSTLGAVSVGRRLDVDLQGVEAGVVEAGLHEAYVGAEDVDPGEAAVAAELADDPPGLVVQELCHDVHLICASDLCPLSTHTAINQHLPGKNRKKKKKKKMILCMWSFIYLVWAELEGPDGEAPGLSPDLVAAEVVVEPAGAVVVVVLAAEGGVGEHAPHEHDQAEQGVADLEGRMVARDVRVPRARRPRDGLLVRLACFVGGVREDGVLRRRRRHGGSGGGERALVRNLI